MAVSAPSILIVEDDPNIGQLLVFLFQRSGFEPLLLRDGRAAEEYVTTHGPVAVAILDMLLPYRDGFAVVEAIRSDPRWHPIPIVVLSAKPPELDTERSHQARISDWVSKPFQPAALLARVRSLVAQRTA